jgi:hypothetical protein
MALGASRGNLVSLILNEALILSCAGFARGLIRPGPDRSRLRGPCLAQHPLRSRFHVRSRFHGLCRNRSRFRCPASSFDCRRLGPSALGSRSRAHAGAAHGLTRRARRRSSADPRQPSQDNGSGTTDPGQRTRDNGPWNKRSKKESNGADAPAQSLCVGASAPDATSLGN